jgi:hypothetical protein
MYLFFPFRERHFNFAFEVIGTLRVPKLFKHKAYTNKTLFQSFERVPVTLGDADSPPGSIRVRAEGPVSHHDWPSEEFVDHAHLTFAPAAGYGETALDAR